MENISAFLSELHKRRAGIQASPAVMLGVFAVTLFASALMLFSVQPMFAKMALPKLGGTPAVWAVSMCFFQIALLAGYCYAHALNRWLDPGRAVLAHLTLLALTSFALPIALPASLSEPPAEGAYTWLFGVLALGVGAPFFAVSANAPLLQAWFARSGHSAAKDPYFLYGASNLGSLIALLAYPLAFEPVFGLSFQSSIWSVGFAILAFMIGACGMLMLTGQASQSGALTSTPADGAEVSEPLSLATRASWVALAAIPSGLMVAVTTYITTDIASAPFIWVVPLALFLGTFILVFKNELGFNYAWVQAGLPVAILLHVLFPAHISAALIGLIAFMLAALVCHRELYLRRPGAAQLTEFYIWMSFGGVVGGIFSALIAPNIFSSVVEFKLLLLASLLCRPGVLSGLDVDIKAWRVLAVGAAMAIVLMLYKWLVAAKILSSGALPLGFLIAAAVGGVFLTSKWAEHRAILVMAMIAGMLVMPGDTSTIYMERSFFGTMRVTETENGQHRMMLHGTTFHGAQRIRTANGTAVTAADPATYYHPGSPMERGIGAARQAVAGRAATLNVGVVGLGAGSLACYAKPNETWRYYEIDPMVARIARDPKLFNFLSRCMPSNDIVLGDARLTLQKEPAAKYDYLVIDAFSSDAIPAHLLTREAMQSYFDKLAPGGLLAIHISNRFLELAPSIAATVATLPGIKGTGVLSDPTGKFPDATASHVIFLSRDSTTIAGIARWPDAHPLEPAGAKPWTDDFSDVLSALMRHLISPRT